MENNTARIVFAVCAVILLGIIVAAFLYGHGFSFDFRSYLINRNIRQ